MNSHTYALTDPVALVAKLRSLGGPAVDPTQPTGTATADGVTLAWSVTAKQVTIIIIKLPFFVSNDEVWSHVEKVLGDPIA
jgi:hypothetical protein